MTSLLVTNDFPPKHGGIQSYLYELWRRLPNDDTVVFTSRFPGDLDWDRGQPFRVVRSRPRCSCRRARSSPTSMRSRVTSAPTSCSSTPGSRSTRSLRVCAPPRTSWWCTAPRSRCGPAARRAARRATRAAETAAVVAAGAFPPEAVRQRAPAPRWSCRRASTPTASAPLDTEERAKARAAFALDPDVPLVVGVSRLVPRKGFDVLLDALAGLAGVHLRDRRRGPRPGPAGAPCGGAAWRVGVSFLGRVSDNELPALFGCGDVFAMPCRDRWGGLEAEGFGIVFLEAAAAGVPVVAGRSGGSHEAVDDTTGAVVDGRSVAAVRDGDAALLRDDTVRVAKGAAARARRGSSRMTTSCGGWSRLRAATSRAWACCVSDPATSSARYAASSHSAGWRARCSSSPGAGGGGVSTRSVVCRSRCASCCSSCRSARSSTRSSSPPPAAPTGDNVAVANLFFLQDRRRVRCRCSSSPCSACACSSRSRRWCGHRSGSSFPCCRSDSPASGPRATARPPRLPPSR